jgi:hypothetical protein
MAIEPVQLFPTTPRPRLSLADHNSCSRAAAASRRMHTAFLS